MFNNTVLSLTPHHGNLHPYEEGKQTSLKEA